MNTARWNFFNYVLAFIFASIMVLAITFLVLQEDDINFWLGTAICTSILCITFGGYPLCSSRRSPTLHLFLYPIPIFITTMGWHVLLTRTLHEVWGKEPNIAAQTTFIFALITPLIVLLITWTWFGTLYQKVCIRAELEKTDLQGYSFFVFTFSLLSFTFGIWSLEILLQTKTSCTLQRVCWMALVSTFGLEIVTCFFMLRQAWTKLAEYFGYYGLSGLQLVKITFCCIVGADTWTSNYDCSTTQIHFVAIILVGLTTFLWLALPVLSIVYLLIKNCVEMESFRLNVYLRRTLRRKIGRTIDTGLQKLFNEDQIEKTVWMYLGNPVYEWFDLFPDYYPCCCPILYRYCGICPCYKKLKELDKQWEPKFPLEVYEIDINELLGINETQEPTRTELTTEKSDNRL